MSQNPGTDTPKHGFAALEEARQRSLKAARRASQEKSNPGTDRSPDTRGTPSKSGRPLNSKHH